VQAGTASKPPSRSGRNCRFSAKAWPSARTAEALMNSREKRLLLTSR
jgi:hypothetical protein